GRVVAGHDLVTLDLQLGQDAFGIDQRLGAAKADETDLVGRLGHGRRYRETAGQQAIIREGRTAMARRKAWHTRLCAMPPTFGMRSRSPAPRTLRHRQCTAKFGGSVRSRVVSQSSFPTPFPFEA